GVKPYTWSGSLPDGLTIDPLTGVVSGTLVTVSTTDVKSPSGTATASSPPATSCGRSPTDSSRFPTSPTPRTGTRSRPSTTPAFTTSSGAPVITCERSAPAWSPTPHRRPAPAYPTDPTSR